MSKKRTTKRTRKGDKVIITTVEQVELDAVVDFTDIVDAVCFDQDDSGHYPPWVEHDGWEHELVPTSEDYDDAVGYLPQGYYATAGCKKGRSYFQPQMIELKEYLGCYDYLHNSGSSKQTAREHEAHVHRESKECLAKWHQEGFVWWEAHVNFQGYRASLGMIDSLEDGYDKYTANELAEQVADDMEKDGFTIVNRPEPKLLCINNGYKAGRTREQWKEAYYENLHSQDNKSTRHWTQSRAYRRAYRRLERAPVPVSINTVAMSYCRVGTQSQLDSPVRLDGGGRSA